MATYLCMFMCCTAIGKVQKTPHMSLKSANDKYNFQRKYFVGGVKVKENIAIFLSEFGDEVDINTLLQVPDKKKLTVWTDKNECWKK